MNWPMSQDYNEAIQSPQTIFSDPELRTGQPVVNALGLPVPCSGNFADVYELDCPQTQTKWAVKCFTREVRGLRERYAAISRYLESAALPVIVDFQYREQGIRIRGTWYPILKMRWVEGLLLNLFVRDNLDKLSRLEALSQVWARMANRLREAKLAHADLQHGNVILVPGRKDNSLAIKLIDYDGMFVPALAGKTSGEVGHANYQHPQRLKEGNLRPRGRSLPPAGRCDRPARVDGRRVATVGPLRQRGQLAVPGAGLAEPARLRAVPGPGAPERSRSAAAGGLPQPGGLQVDRADAAAGGTDSDQPQITAPAGRTREGLEMVDGGHADSCCSV